METHTREQQTLIFQNLGRDAAEPLAIWLAHHVRCSAVLKFLMQQHDLRQSDLPEIGSQGVVSEVLSGQREMNARQIKRLAKRFGVSPVVFV